MLTVYILSHPSPHESSDLCSLCRWTGSLPTVVHWSPSGPHHRTHQCTGSLKSATVRDLPLYLKGLATHSRILAWRIPWAEEPDGLYSLWGHKESDTTEWLTFLYPNSDPFHILFLKFFNSFKDFIEYWRLIIHQNNLNVFIHSELCIEYPPHDWHLLNKENSKCLTTVFQRWRWGTVLSCLPISMMQSQNSREIITVTILRKKSRISGRKVWTL